MTELTRADRKAAVARLDELAAEIAAIGTWLDQYGDLADKSSVLCECSSRDLLAAAWILRPSDHTLPPDHLADSKAMRG